MRQAGHQSCQQIKKQIPEMTHPVFHIIAKNKKDPHIGNKMPPPSVHEGIGNKREIIVGIQSEKPGPFGMGIPRRNQAKKVKKCLLFLWIQGQLKEKHSSTGQYYCPVHVRKVPVGYIVS